jgi:hypothetical protein
MEGNVVSSAVCPASGIVKIPDLRAFLPWNFDRTLNSFHTFLDLGSMQMGKQVTLCSWRALRQARWIDEDTKR